MDGSTKLSDVFQDDFTPFMEEYVKEVRRILERYGAVVFVARKAACFYLALRKQGLLEEHPVCTVVSSRALGYSDLELGEGSVAIVDDAVVSGTSVLGAKRLLERHGRECDVYVAARSTDLMRAEASDMRVSAIRDLETPQIYELAREITLFIQSAAVTNNIDQPIFRVTFASDEALNDVFLERDWIDLSTRTQVRNGVLNEVLLYDAISLFEGLVGTMMSTEGIVAKVRLLSDGRERAISIIPFVIFPELESFLVDSLFQMVAYDGLYDHVGNPNPDEELRNKLRVVQYTFARYLGERFVDGLEGVVSSTIDGFNEAFLFGKRIDRFLRPNPLCSESIDACAPANVESRRELALRDAGAICAHLLSSSPSASEYSCPGSAPVDFAMVTMSRIRVLLERRELLERGNAVRPRFSSACVDVLVDGGFLVPLIAVGRKQGRRSIVRSYRGGEVLERTRHSLRCLCLAWFCFQDKTGSVLPVSVANKLGLLFLRWFDPSDEISSGDGSVFHLTFVPNKGCSLGKGSQLLSDLLEDMRFVELADGFVAGPGSSCACDEINLEDRRAAQYFASVFAKAKSSLSRRVSFDKLLDYMIVGFGRRYRVRCLKPQISAVESVLRGSLEGPSSRKELAECCDEALSWQKIAASRDDLDRFLESVSWATGQEVYVLSRFCQDSESKGVDVAESESFIGEMGAFLDEAKEHSESNAAPDVRQAERVRLLDKADVIMRVFDTLEYGNHGFRYTRQNVAAIASLVPDRNGRKFSFVTCHAKEDRVACVRSAIRTRDAGAKAFLCFLDEAIPVSLVPMPSDEPKNRLDGIHPRRIRDAVRSSYAVLRGDSPLLLAVYTVPRAAPIPNIPFGLLDGANLTVEREVATNSPYRDAFRIEGYDLSVYVLKEAAVGDVFKDCTIGATRPKGQTVIDQSFGRTGDIVSISTEDGWIEGLRSILDVLEEEQSPYLKRAELAAKHLEDLAATEDESLIEDKWEAFGKLSTILQSSAAAISIFDAIAPAVKTALGLT